MCFEAVFEIIDFVLNVGNAAATVYELFGGKPISDTPLSSESCALMRQHASPTHSPGQCPCCGRPLLEAHQGSAWDPPHPQHPQAPSSASPAPVMTPSWPAIASSTPPPPPSA